jgi:hypothetical protein
MPLTRMECCFSGGLKIPRQKWRAGSIPASGTSIYAGLRETLSFQTAPVSATFSASRDHTFSANEQREGAKGVIDGMANNG